MIHVFPSNYIWEEICVSIQQLIVPFLDQMLYWRIAIPCTSGLQAGYLILGRCNKVLQKTKITAPLETVLYQSFNGMLRHSLATLEGEQDFIFLYRALLS